MDAEEGFMAKITLYAAMFAVLVGIAGAQDTPKGPATDAHGNDNMAGMQMSKPPVRSTALTITFGDKTATWSPETFAALPHVSLTAFNEHAKANQTYSGVPLMALLKPLGVPDKPHGKDLRLCLLAEGADGYGVVFAVAEVNPDVHLGTAIVADAMDGQPLAGDGAFKLVLDGEKRPARWVRNLATIKVKSAE
jgi:hypothetical protein